MKIIALQFLSSAFYVGEQQRTINTTTHDFERLPGEGFLVKHRQTGKVFFVPYAHAIAEIQPSEETEEDAAPPAGRKTRGRARTAQDPPALED